jgi:hypothetical protein
VKAIKARLGLCTMIASPDRIVVQRRESLCSRVKGGVVPAVGADTRGRVLPRQDVIDAHGGQLSDANGHAGANSGPADGPAHRGLRHAQGARQRHDPAAPDAQEGQGGPHRRLFLRGQVERPHEATARVCVPGNVGSTPSWCIA